MNFLIIENDQTTRDAIRFLIEDEGHSAKGVAVSGQAWARSKGKDFDAVLLDLELAQTGGILLKIRKNQPDLPVIMYSAERSEEMAAEALRSGAMDCLEVPFQHEQLARALSQVQALSQSRPPKLIGWNGTCGVTMPAKT